LFDKVLVANRGEIACRVMRTCRALALRTVAVHSTADAHALHVEMADEAYAIGGPAPADSYLRGERIIAVAKASGAKAIHPGYGFLSENAEFARAVEAAGLVFIGPSPEAIATMGLKDRAKTILERAGVPVVPGYHGENQDDDFLAGAARAIGFPLLVKAVAGGGGRGMRLAAHAGEFPAQLAAARREAKGAFGDDRVLLERFVQGPHHIEFQVFGDAHGRCVHLFERECSIQRRHQKVLEESPSPFLDGALRARMGEAAVAAARAIGYRGAGTVEFIVGEDRQFYFMEMNTRLQVEHPVTEMITGQDLVEWQLRVAAGEGLPLAQDEIRAAGHAIEVRLCAENPFNGFLPEAGRVAVLRTPPEADGVRLDTGVREGDSVSVFYDSMIGKLVCRGDDREEAARRMREALARTEILGVRTNLAFLERLVAHPAYLAGNTDTGFIDAHRADLLPPMDEAPLEALVAAAARVHRDERAASPGHSPWDDTGGWRLNQPAVRAMEFRSGDGQPVVVKAEMASGHAMVEVRGRRHRVALGPADGERLQVALDDETFFARVVRHGDLLSVSTPAGRHVLTLVDPFHYEPAELLPDARLTALMPGRVVKLLAGAGDAVRKGQSLVVLEAMKMEHTLVSPRDGVIERVAFAEGDLVPADAVLFAFRD
jgi:3-methylcrotonyl-CoA carboxylase alpha subunit